MTGRALQDRRPFDGRRIWFVGIGGAGLSGYALLAKAWGAEVGGWDRVDTPYLHRLDVEVVLVPEPVVPEGWEVVVSTAYAERVDGRSRADFLAEVVSLQASIVVAGAHGKGTTAAMIAYCLDRLGRDPAFLIGADVPQLGGNARAGEGWLVVEGDESDRTVEALRPKVAVVTNVDLDHHTTFASLAELRGMFDRWLEHVPEVVRCDAVPPVDAELALPGEHNRRNAACALVTLERIGVARDEALPILTEFRGAARRFERRGEGRGVVVYDDYAHHPAEIDAAIAAAREQAPRRVLAVFQPHLYSRTLHLAHELAAALAAADAACVTDIYPARERPIGGVTGKLVVDRLAELRPGMELAWTPKLADAAAFAVRSAREGDLVLTIGAGDVDRAAALVLEALT
jgi:UDP-N-acetylmuramate--alanine ligase